MRGPSITSRLLGACLALLLAVLALQWAASILQQIWPTLAVAGGVVLVVAVVVAVVRRHRDRW